MAHLGSSQFYQQIDHSLTWTPLCNRVPVSNLLNEWTTVKSLCIAPEWRAIFGRYDWDALLRHRRRQSRGGDCYFRAAWKKTRGRICLSADRCLTKFQLKQHSILFKRHRRSEIRQKRCWGIPANRLTGRLSHWLTVQVLKLAQYSWYELNLKARYYAKFLFFSVICLSILYFFCLDHFPI